jgi:hypothetical protein
MDKFYVSELCLRHTVLMEKKFNQTLAIMHDIQTNANKCHDTAKNNSLAIADLMKKIEPIGEQFIQVTTDVINVLLLALLAAVILNIGLGYKVWTNGSVDKRHTELQSAMSKKVRFATPE